MNMPVIALFGFSDLEGGPRTLAWWKSENSMVAHSIVSLTPENNQVSARVEALSVFTGRVGSR